jgi:alkanesulfonate monooxygenase SsuD/methylene tetrahydromethanopterin reductase-like flavin-dependent oxidoreductase (luciferase family)
VNDLLFGLNLSTAAGPGTDVVADARRAERLGYDFVSANDHPNGGNPTHELWTLLAHVAASTSRIKVASRVIGVPYRNPAMLAKMAATLAELSAGRLILGLGGGSSDEGMNAFGIGPLSPRAKIDGLEDALRIVRGLWTQSPFTYEGALHSVFDAHVEPKPGEPIPIWLGTFGPRGLALAGRLADGWIPSLGMAPPERARAMRERVFDAARKAGRDPREISCIYNLQVSVGEPDPDPSIVSGPPQHVIERLLDFVELGFTGFNLVPTGPEADAQPERFARDVLPLVRSGR